MKVAIVLNFPQNDHRLVYARGIADELGRRGHHVLVILQGEGESGGAIPRRHYQVRLLGGNTYSIVGQIRFMLELFFLLLKLKVDVVHGRNPFSSVLPAIILRNLGLLNCVIVYDARGMWVESAYLTGRLRGPAYRIVHALEDFVMNTADRLISISPKMKEWILDRGVSPDRVDVVLGDGVDLEPFQTTTRYARTEGTWRLGYVGSISVLRGTPEILRAISIVRDEIQDNVILILAGPVDETFREILSLVEELHLQRNVDVKGRLPHEKAIEIIGELDLGLSYDKPGWPPSEVAVHTKLFEYLAAGVPVVATRHPANYSVLTDGFDAVLTYPSTREFAAGIVELMRNPTLLKSMRENALKTARKHDISRKAEQVKRAYIRALRDRPGGSPSIDSEIEVE